MRAYLALVGVLVVGCFNPEEPQDTDGIASTGPEPEPGSTGPNPSTTTAVDPDSSTTSVDPDTTSDPDSSGGSSGSSTGAPECEPGTYGPDCSGVCDCNDGTCSDGMDGDGSCTCLPGTFGSACAGVCDCGAAACDEGATGTGLCLCPDPVGTFTVAYLPGWGAVSSPNLAYTAIQSDWASYGDCEPQYVSLTQPITADSLANSGAHVVLAANPSGISIQFSPAEILAIRNHVMAGNAGFVATYLLRGGGADNSPLADLAGIDPLAHLGTSSVACDEVIDVLEPRHPLARNLPATFSLVPSFANAQDMGGPWAAALLGSAEIVLESNDQLNVVVAYEGATWRGSRISTFPEYESVVEGRQLVYNALLWASYPPVP